MKGIEFALLALGAVAGAFVRYKIAESPLILGTLPVNILIINVIGSFILGMKVGDMKDIAKFIKRVVVDKEDPKKVGKDVAKFRKEFQKVQYAFDNAVKAYEYISLTRK